MRWNWYNDDLIARDSAKNCFALIDGGKAVFGGLCFECYANQVVPVT